MFNRRIKVKNTSNNTIERAGFVFPPKTTIDIIIKQDKLSQVLSCNDLVRVDKKAKANEAGNNKVVKNTEGNSETFENSSDAQEVAGTNVNTDEEGQVSQEGSEIEENSDSSEEEVNGDTNANTEDQVTEDQNSSEGSQKGYNCHECEEFFGSKKKLKTHIKNEHPEKWEEMKQKKKGDK